MNATAGANATAALLTNFGDLSLGCMGPSGTAGTVTLAVTDSRPQGGVFAASAIDETGAVHTDEGAVAGAAGGIPATTDFTFPITDYGQISFSYKTVIGTTTEVVSGTLTMIQNNGCTAFGNADSSSVAN